MGIISKLNWDILENHKFVYSNLNKSLKELANTRGIPYHEDLVPMFYSDFSKKTGKILIVGINPSFNDKIHKGYDKNYFKYTSFNKLDENEKSQKIKDLIELQEGLITGKVKNQKQIQYFKKIELFSNEIGFNNSWSHYDIFPIRCTNQNLFISCINQNQFKKYKSDQLKKFNSIIDKNNFKAIFILNKVSSCFLRDEIQEMKFIKKFNDFKDPIYGLYKIKNTPVILFKQLSQGATSNTEFEKLINQTRNLL